LGGFQRSAVIKVSEAIAHLPITWADDSREGKFKPACPIVAPGRESSLSIRIAANAATLQGVPGKREKEKGGHASDRLPAVNPCPTLSGGQ